MRTAITWNKLPLPTGRSLIRKSFRDCFTIARRLRTVRTIRLLAPAIYICIGKQICPEDNGWSDRRVTERVPETCTKFLHGAVINELALRTNTLSRPAIFNRATRKYDNWMYLLKRRWPVDHLAKFNYIISIKVLRNVYCYYTHLFYFRGSLKLSSIY